MKKNSLKIYQSALRQKWYIQGFNGLPVFLNVAAWSGLTIKKYLGYQYHQYFLDYRRGYCECGYLANDLVEIWQIVKKRLALDPDYLKKIKAKYQCQFIQSAKYFTAIESRRLQELSAAELLALLKSGVEVMIKSVGVAHVIEAVGMGLEKDFKRQLILAVGTDKKFNEYFTILTTPTRLSFLTQEERELKNIARHTPAVQAKQLAAHAARYFGWPIVTRERQNSLPNILPGAYAC